eukprot:scaffold25593_cov123-Isochrysis_galbana.AAC.1
MNRARGYYSYSTHFTRVVWPARARARPPTPVRARPQRHKAYNKNRLYKHESCEMRDNDSQQPTPTTPKPSEPKQEEAGSSKPEDEAQG